MSYPGVAANGNLIYIYEDGTLQIYNIKTRMVNVHYFMHGVNKSELFYTDGKLYIVGGYQENILGGNQENIVAGWQQDIAGDRQQGIDSSIQPENVFSVDVSRIGSE